MASGETEFLKLCTIASQRLEAMQVETASYHKSLKKRKNSLTRRMGPVKKPRNCSSQEFSYEQHRALSMRELVDRFTQLTDDELSRKFKYTCMLLPSKCCVFFESFGSKDTALIKMKAHLKSHMDGFLSATLITPCKSKAEIQLFSEEDPRPSADTQALLDENTSLKEWLKILFEETTSCSAFGEGLSSETALDKMKACLKKHWDAKISAAVITPCRSKAEIELFSEEDLCFAADTVVKTRSRSKAEIEAFSEEDPRSSADIQAILDENSSLKEWMKIIFEETTSCSAFGEGLSSETALDKMKAYFKKHRETKAYAAVITPCRSKAEIELFSEKDPSCTGFVQGASSMQVRNPESQNHTKCPLSDTDLDEMIDTSCKDTINRSEAETEKSLEVDPRSAQFVALLLAHIKEVNSVLHNDHEYYAKEKLQAKKMEFVESLEAMWQTPIDPAVFYTVDSPSTIDSLPTIERPIVPPIIQPQFIVQTPAFPYVHVAENFDLAGIEECEADGTPVNPKLQCQCCAVHLDFDIEGKKLCSKAKKNSLGTDKKFPMSSRRQIVTGSVLECMENQAEFISSGVLRVPRNPRVLNYNNSENSENLVKISKAFCDKLIAEVRAQKKKKGGYKCKLCTDKQFTAQASLIHHYRSHAGIKPHTCTVCRRQFTRRHSLNYHMTIHNEITRFQCSEPSCNRVFRHPSHFKDHMRNHTGETPYKCSDCDTHFKTRNTYKRHLSIKHGKLLTAKGKIDIKKD